MTDYLPLLTRAVANLEKSPEGRRAVYDRARQALVNQLRSMNPPLAESEITRERLALEEAIRRTEMQTTKAEAPPVPPRTPAAPPGPPPGAAPPEPINAPAAAPAVPPPVPAGPVQGKPPPAPPVRPLATPTPPPRERPAEPAPGSRVMRETVAGARQIGGATAEAARSARAAMGDAPAAYELETMAEAPPDPRVRPGASDETLAEPVQPRPPRGRTQDFAKADARKALQAKLIVGGIVGALLAVAILIGYVHRDRIFASLGMGSAPRAAAPAQSEGPKVSDRVAPDPQTAARAPAQQQPGSAPSTPAAAVAQRAVLYEENPGAGGQQLQTFVGTAVWKTETVNPGPGRPPELGLRVEVEIPDRKMTVAMTIRRNPDQTLPASHTIEVQFTTPNDPFGGVANLPGIRAKTTETAQGAPLVGLVVRVMPGFFLVGLSAIDADREQNLSLLRERGWLDVPFVYNNGRRAVLVIEKGTPGERAVNEALAAWGG